MTATLSMIVIDDPTGQLHQGEVTNEVNKLRKLFQAGGCALPYESIRYGIICNSSFAFHPWGKGWAFDMPSASKGCPMVVMMHAGIRNIYWAARVVPIEARKPVTLRARLIARNTEGPAGVGVVKPVELSQIAPDARGGWTVFGQNEFNSTIEGMTQVLLYAGGSNARVIWTAVTQSTQMVDELGIGF